jgi:hypothetical protein
VTRPPRRGWLASAYALCALAGAASLVWQSPAIAAAGVWAYAWGVLLIVGGVASAGGVMRNHWLGEWCGVPPLIAVWLVYGVTAGWAIVADHQLVRSPGSLALLAIACLMTWRWQVVSGERRAARQIRDRG